ncbi:MAG: TraB/GumN family protein, partial [Methanothrix sp.]|nr:TraB/GumN family protein [Methanothrix sp.]
MANGKAEEVPVSSVSLSGAHEILVLGTAHVSERSVEEVRRAIEERRPDIVAVELCPSRYRALLG